MSTNTAKQLPPFLSVVANSAWYWERPRQPQTVQEFAFDLYHDHPQDVDGRHREENAIYHIIEVPVYGPPHYHTLPADKKNDFNL